MSVDVRAISKTYLTKILGEMDKRADKKLRSDRDGMLYTDLCAEDLVGTRFKTIQEKLQDNWDHGGGMTTCLSFVLTYAKRLGFQMKYPGGYMADFHVDTSLAKNPPAKAYAWMPFGGDKRPKYGDVVLFSDSHIGISLDMADATWNTLESGQGGPLMHHDEIEKKTQTYSDRAHVGWVDLDLYFGVPPAPPPPAGDGKSGSLWLNQDGDLVHPDAPTGGGGPGFFRLASALGTDPSNDDLPHPWSPAARTLDPVALADANSGDG